MAYLPYGCNIFEAPFNHTVGQAGEFTCIFRPVKIEDEKFFGIFFSTPAMFCVFFPS